MKKIFLNSHQSWWISIAFVFLSTLTSFTIIALVHPDLLIHHKMVLLHQHDTEVPFLGVFTLVSHYYQGGIQLWDRFDLMRYDFNHITSGIYTLANLMTATAYIALSSFFKYPGESFQSIHSIFYHVSCIFIRTIGGYLLLRRFDLRPWIIFISLVYLNTLLATIYYLGLYLNGYFSFLPLLLYFILRFFETSRLNDFLLAFLTMTIIVANCPFMALGYFYQAVHFFILACLVGFIFRSGRQSLNKFLIKVKQGITARNICKIALAGALCFAIMLPFLQMERTITTDFFIPDGEEVRGGDRMANKYSIAKYFSKSDFKKPDPYEFFSQAVDFWDYRFSEWLFLGFSTLFFTAIGLIFSKDKRKHLFLWPIILIIGLQFPRDPSSFTSLAHWINVLTNPFHFLVRAPITIVLIPTIMLPIIALGINSFTNLVYYNQSGSIYFERLSTGAKILISTLFIYIFCFVGQGHPLEVTIKTLFFIILIFLVYALVFWEQIRFQVLSFLAKYRAKVVVSCILGFLAIDIILLSVYMKNDTWSNVRIFAGKINSLDDPGLITPIYQNPKIFPFREYYRGDSNELISRDPQAQIQFKIRNPKYFSNGRSQDPDKVSWYRLNTRESLYGLFYQFNHLGRFLFPAVIYHPRPFIFKNMENDLTANHYLNYDERLMFLASHSILNDSNPNLANPLILNRLAVSIEGTDPDHTNELSTGFNSVDLESSIALGQATGDYVLSSVMVLFDLFEGHHGDLILSAVDKHNNIRAQGILETEESAKPSLLKKFIFPTPITIKNNDPVDLIISTTNLSGGKYKISQAKNDNSFLYFEIGHPPAKTLEHQYPARLGKSREMNSFIEYAFDLPDDFPSYVASTIFTKDQYSMTVALDNHLFQAAQGKLVRPFTFDVQNLQTGKLTIALPSSLKLSEEKLTFRYTLPSGILDISKNSHDNFEFKYLASKDGWLVLHYPYDQKLRLTVDEKPVQIYKANKYFIGIPIQKGEHKIHLQYWPDTWLRSSIVLSVVLTTLAFFSLIIFGIKSENSLNSSAENVAAKSF